MSNIRILYPILSLCFLSLLYSGCAVARQGAIKFAQSGISVGNYNNALGQLTDAGNYGKADPITDAEIAYLKGVCYDGIGSPGEAKALYRFVVDRYPDTEYGYMAQAKLTNDDTFMAVTGPAFFSAYDGRLFTSITNSWYHLLKPVEPKAKSGITVLRFNLHSDGQITDVKVTRNTTSQSIASICQRAVLDPAPYESWTPEMLAAEGQSYRTITFRFDYLP